MDIYNFLEVKNNHPELLAYQYPTKSGEFFGTLVFACWAPNGIIHTFWNMSDGNKLDCCLFRDNHCKYICDIETVPRGTIAKLNLVKSESEKVWLKGIEICRKK